MALSIPILMGAMGTAILAYRSLWILWGDLAAQAARAVFAEAF